MKITRKWRRAWMRNKPNFLKHAALERQRYKKQQLDNKSDIKRQSKQHKKNMMPSSLLSKIIRPTAVAAGVVLTVMMSNPTVNAMPADGKVVAGQGTVVQNGTNMTITQTTDKMALNWQSFNIAKNEKVQFVQPGLNSTALNRVIGNNASQIYGQLSSNGKVFLINTNGILFSPTARVDTGALVASTLNITDSDFMTGSYRFSKGSTTGNVSNQGNITAAEGGYVALLGEKAINEGVIIASKGSVVLGAGEQATLDMTGDGLINLAVTQTSMNAQVENKNLIQADGGMILMTARAAGNLAGSVVNNSGVVRAQTLGERNGKIVLDGGNVGVVTNSGTLNATGSNGATNGGSVTINTSNMAVDTGIIDVSGANGGEVAVNALHLLQSGTIKADGSNVGGDITIQAGKIIQTASANISANSSNGVGGKIKVVADNSILSSAQLSATGVGGGEIDILGKDIALLAAKADAAGVNQGGQIHIGGDFQGIGTRKQADKVFVNSFTTLDASAKVLGNGGKSIVWSNNSTQFYGTIKAKGGAAGGDGGVMEVSGKKAYTYAGKADASAVKGKAGSLLLDPKNVIIDDVTATVANTDIMGPAGSNTFGNWGLTPVSNGNVLITDPTYDPGSAASAGAVYLYNVGTGSMISALTGSHANDAVGSGNIYKLMNNGVETGNFVMGTGSWNSGAGAATWGNITTGFKNGGGVVSATNSMIGDTASDNIGSGVTVLNNGNYFLSSINWHSNKGAVTWADGAIGAVGTVSAVNSLVGSTANDHIGNITLLKNNNSNVVVSSSDWDNGAVLDAGFATLINSTDGTLLDGSHGGTISATNALVGTQKYDRVSSGGITALSNGNYVVDSFEWHNTAVNPYNVNTTVGNPNTPATFTALGAVTWVNGTTGAVGAVATANSLTGTTPGNSVGSDGAGGTIAALNNGNYVVGSRVWNGNTGAATWVNGANGYIYNSSSQSGTISSSNSLIGNQNGSFVANSIVPLANGNYVVVSPYWSNGATLWIGATTWGNGSTGTAGTVTAANSLTGINQYELLGGTYGVTALKNGNYIVNDINWNSSNTGSFVSSDPTGYGKVIWVDGTNGNIAGLGTKNGTSTTASGLAGTTSGAQVGSGNITSLANNHYVVSSPNWNSAFGAATWVDGATGNIGNSSSPAGVISSANSLVGSHANDRVGSSITKLIGSSNYVVGSGSWNGGIGAATWVNGDNGNIAGTSSLGGTVSATNSLVGSAAGDSVGSSVTGLTNGNYVVASSTWNNGRGAVTWGKGTNGTLADGSGPGATISDSNSMVGSVDGDGIGDYGVTPLENGNYIFQSGALNSYAGAITWGDGTLGITGTLSAANSYFGTSANSTNGLVPTYDYIHNKVLIGVPDSNKVAVWSPGSGSSSSTTLADVAVFGNYSADSLTIDRGLITTTLNAGTDVIIQANNDITVNKDVVSTASHGGNFTMQAGRNINIKANLTTANGNLTLTANDSNAVAANRDSGAGGITLDSGKTINAGTGAVTMTVDTASTAGAVNLAGNLSADNLSSTGQTTATIGGNVSTIHNVIMRGNGNITLGAGSSISSTSGNIVLDGGATGNFINNSGSTALQANSGFWRVYSLNPANDTKGGLAYNFKQYNTSYNGGVQGTGNGFIYSIAPNLTVNLTGTVTKTYDRTDSATLGSANYGVSGAIDGDSILLNNPVNGIYNNKNVATGKTVSVGGIALSSATDGGANVYGYTLSSNSASGAIGTITTKALTYNVANATATYGTLATAGVATLTGIESGDTVQGTVGIYDGSNNSVALVAKTNAGTYTEKATALTGTDSSNYTIANTGNTTGVLTVDKKAITITPDSNQTMVYNGNVPTTTGLTYGNSGLVTGDTLSGLLAVDGASKNVGSYNLLRGTVAINDGNGGNNYDVTFTPSVKYTITPKQLTISGLTIANKTYDRTTNATVSGTPGLIGIVESDDVTVGGAATATFVDANAGDNKAVSVSGISLVGTDMSNYSLSSTASGTATIAKKKLTYSVADANSTYGTVAIPGVATLTGVIAGDTSDLAGIVAIADSSSNPVNLTNKTNVGTYTEKVTAFSGTAAGNYEVDTVGNSNGTLTINQKSITITPDSNQTMVYNGNVPTTTGLTYGNSGLVTGDTLSGLLAVDGASKNVGSYNLLRGTVTVNDGNGGNNYDVTFTPNIKYNITPKQLTISGLTIANKTYDRTTSATVSGTPGLTGIVESDDVTVGGTATATFVDANAGDNKAVSVSGISLAGTDMSNYSLSSTASGTATIAKKKLTYSVADANSTYGTVATPGVATLTGVIAGDTSDLAGIVAIADSSSNPVNLTNKTNVGTYTEKVTAFSGIAAGNYEVDTVGNNNGTLTINQKSITITPDSNQTMVYNGNVPTTTGLTYGNSGLVTGDTLSGLLAVDGASKNVGSYNLLRGTVAINDGNGGNNYDVTFTPNIKYSITPKQLTISGLTIANKTYDRTTNATVSGTPGLTGIVGSDDVTVGGTGTATFVDANAGDNKAVSVSGISLAGTEMSNYSLSSTASATATIAKANISGVTGITANNKVYDGNRNATLTTINAGFTGMISGDSLTAETATGSFSDPNIGNAKTVSISGITLGGSGASNYHLSNDTAITTADITAPTNPQVENGKNAVLTVKPIIVQPIMNQTDTNPVSVVQVDNGGINTNHTVTIPTNNVITPPSTVAPLSGNIRLIGTGNQTQNYTMTITNQSVTVSLPSAAATAGTDNNVSANNTVSANNVAIISVGGRGVTSVVDTYNISSTGSNLTVNSSTMGTSNADRPQEPVSGAKTETFKLEKADGSIAEFSVSYADGALSIKPLNAEAVSLGQDSGEERKILAATSIVTARDKLGVQANTIEAVYINKQ